MNTLTSPLILPGDAEYHLTLNGMLPPVDRDRQPLFIQRPGSCLLEPATPEEMTEYLLSGEYDERLTEIDDDWDDWEDEEWNPDFSLI
jgi:hypothetical protein